MATFPDIEASFPVRKISKPNTRTVKFGDGYEHRLLFGLNQNPKVFNLTWKNISETDSDTIETFDVEMTYQWYDTLDPTGTSQIGTGA